jgi:hypothetical protein
VGLPGQPGKLTLSNEMKTLRIPFLALLLGLCQLPLQADQAYAPPRLDSPDSWSMIVLPDVQSYVKFGRNQPLLELMTAWIAEQIDPLNIGLVLCTGDLVEQNEIIDPAGPKLNQPSKAQWESVAQAFGRLDGRVPYVTCTGNHDYGYRNAEDRRTQFNRYFPVDKNFRNQQLLRAAAHNAAGTPTLENAAYEVVSPQGRPFLVLSLEFAPRDAIIDWARAVVDQPQYADHTVILLTHSYMNRHGVRFEKENYPLTDANYGAAIWRKLVEPARNIQLVIAGHIGGADDVEAHLAFRSDPNAAGKTVQQMVFNAQALGGGWYGNGGDGWLRILEFLPDGKTVQVRTFSPLFAISPATQHLAWRREAYDEFTFVLE